MVPDKFMPTETAFKTTKTIKSRIIEESCIDLYESYLWSEINIPTVKQMTGISQQKLEDYVQMVEQVVGQYLYEEDEFVKPLPKDGWLLNKEGMTK